MLTAKDGSYSNGRGLEKALSFIPESELAPRAGTLRPELDDPWISQSELDLVFCAQIRQRGKQE